MNKKTKSRLIKGSIVGALGAALAGGAAYLMSNKKARQKVVKLLKDVETMGESEVGKVLKSVRSAKSKSEKKVKAVLKKVNNKRK